MKRTWNLVPVSQIFQKITENYCTCLYLSTGQVWWLHDLWFKRYIQKCTLSHALVTDLVNLGMVKNTKTWISSERNIISLQNKNILNMYFRWHILRSYHFIAKVTFTWLLKSKFVDDNSKSWPEKGSSLKIKVPISFFVRIHTAKGMCSLCVNLISLIKRNHVQAGPC